MTIEEANQYIEQAARVFAKTQKHPAPPEEDQVALANLAVFFVIRAELHGVTFNQNALDLLMTYLVTAYNLGTNQDWEAWQE